MGRKIRKKVDKITVNYSSRCDDREFLLLEATMNFIAYFIMLDSSDDSNAIKKQNAELKVSQLSTETASLLYAYRLGNMNPLLDKIQASNLSFMDQNAKDTLINYLTVN